jgi:GT2 family glycosyltransferase
MSKKTTDLEIIILTYNSSFWLKKTLSTLKLHFCDATKLSYSVVVVDNHSDDDTLSMLESEFKWVTVMTEPENKGYSHGNNQALRLSTSRYVLLLNSDMELTSATNFDSLIAYMDEHLEVGICTPKVVFMDGSIDPACHRGEPTLWASFSYLTGIEQLFPQTQLFGQYHQSYKDYTSIHEIDACSGAAMLIRGTMLHEVGLLDERFFMYAEDLDYCKRVRDAGHKIVYVPTTTVIHHKYKSGIKGSSKKIARETQQHFYNTMLQYFDKHYAKRYPSFVRSVIHAVLVMKKGAL